MLLNSPDPVEYIMQYVLILSTTSGLCGSIEVNLTFQEELSQLKVTIIKCKVSWNVTGNIPTLNLITT